MKAYVKLGMAMVTGFGLGAVAVHQLHAQASPPAYVISEIDVVDESGYSSDYLPIVKKAMANSGEKRIVSGGNTLSIAGDPPKSRVVVSMFESMDKAQAVFTSQAYQDAQNIGE